MIADPAADDVGDLAELEWRDRALCAQVDTELFFPEKGGSTKEAKAVCGRCEVRAECAAYALDRNERYGIWGGLSEVDRRRIRRHSTAAPASAAPAGTQPGPDRQPSPDPATAAARSDSRNSTSDAA